MRHTFSVHSLAIMANEGLDLYHSMPLLSAYLGHRSLTATEGYVRLTAEMYPEITERTNALTINTFPTLNLKTGYNEAN